MTEHQHDYQYQGHAPQADVELTAFGFGCGVADVDGVCSAVVLRMATDIGILGTVISRVEMTPQTARELADKLQDMAHLVEVGERVP